MILALVTRVVFINFSVSEGDGPQESKSKEYSEKQKDVIQKLVNLR
jgi:hypothetical protein